MLKIIFSDNVDFGLPDHLVEESCIQVLRRLENNPTNTFVHRTGQILVWSTFIKLIRNEYNGLRSEVEFHTINGKGKCVDNMMLTTQNKD